MTDRGALPPKLYFRIGEVAGLVGVEPHVLRYWEREFRSIRPTKSAKGQRVYSHRDVENLLRVRELLYGQGFTIAGARKRLRDKEAPEASPPPVDDAPNGHVTPEAATPPLATQLLAAPDGPRPAPPVEDAGPSPHVRSKLLALKAEVEAFLEDLGGAP
jgi:DNA-binding transcriptional MerR regulator